MEEEEQRKTPPVFGHLIAKNKAGLKLARTWRRGRDIASLFHSKMLEVNFCAFFASPNPR
jgi:hypothetical protein